MSYCLKIMQEAIANCLMNTNATDKTQGKSSKSKEWLTAIEEVEKFPLCFIQYLVWHTGSETGKLNLEITMVA